MQLLRFSRLHIDKLLLNRGYSTARSTSLDTEFQPSYYHHIGKEPLKYRTIGQQYEICVEKYADREAVVSIHENKRLTFANILDECDRLAASLQKIGLERGDRIGIWAPNYVFWYVSMLAAARAGLVSVGINPAFQASEIEYCINKVQLKAIIAPETFKTTHYYEMLKRIIPKLVDSKAGKIQCEKMPSLKSIIINSERKLPGTFRYDEIINDAGSKDVAKIKTSHRQIQPDSPGHIQFTSGTTGHPKAAVITHFNCVNNGIHVANRNELDTKPHRACVQVPLFHAYGVIVGIMAGITYGTTLVLPSASFNPNASLEAISREKCTILYGTPTMYVDLIKHLKDSKYKITTPEIAVTGGASCSPQLFKNIKDYLKVDKIKSVFGQTEVTAVACQSLYDETDDHVLHTVGHVQDHTEVKVIDADGNIVPLGQPGELCIRGYLTAQGYYGDEKKTKELIGDDKWLRTGDQFILEANGYGRIVGRLKEMVIRGGENIFPKEVEDFLNTHPDIIENHVVGVPDERFGEELCAFVRLKDGCTELTQEDIKKFGTDKIAHFKIPRYIQIVNKFPKTVSGKIQKFKLQKIFSETKS